MDITIRLGQVDIEPVDCVRDLGVLLDSSLSTRQHIARITSTCFFHLRRLRKLSRILDIDARKRLVCALILMRVDYCNTALAGLPDSALAPLQRVLHAAAQFVLDSRPRDHVTVALRILNWLPVRQRITYKLCTLMHGVAFGHAPTYTYTSRRRHCGLDHSSNVRYLGGACNRTRAYLTTRCRRTTLDATRKSASAVGRQWTVRRTMGVIVGRFQSLLRCWSASLESATHISSSNGICRS